MKEFKKLERSLYLDILGTIIFVIASIPIWLNFNQDELYKVAKSYENYKYVNYELVNGATYALAPMSDEDAYFTSQIANVIVYNTSNTAEDYTLYLIFEDSIKTDSLKISVNENISYLKDYQYEVKDGKRYYTIVKDNIVANKENYQIYMWNDINAQNSEGYLTPEFIVA